MQAAIDPPLMRVAQAAGSRQPRFRACRHRAISRRHLRIILLHNIIMFSVKSAAYKYAIMAAPIDMINLLWQK